MASIAQMKHCTVLCSKVSELRSGDRFCDVDVKVDERTFKCHRLILSAASAYFDAMFSGYFKEKCAPEVTLSEIRANVFEVMLQFIYTGDASGINRSNVFEIIRAVDFYELPSMEESCKEFVQKNLNALLADDVLKMFVYVHAIEMRPLLQLLSEHIYKNFDYFSKTPTLCVLTYDSLKTILDRIDAGKPGLHDVFLDGILAWIQGRVGLTVEERASFFNSLTEYINFQNLSVECNEYTIKRYVKCSLLLSGGVANKDLEPALTDEPVHRSSKLLHAFVARSLFEVDELQNPDATSIFTIRRSVNYQAKYDRYAWIRAGALECSPDFMRNVVIDDRVYSLRYFEERLGDICGQQPQTFSSSSTSSASMYPYSSLNPPPVTMDAFDMCGTRENIYVYNKRIVSQYSSDGVYSYSRDIDRWLRLPSPRHRYANACLTCNTDDDRIVYLIGGTNSGRCVQAYDLRAENWNLLSSTEGLYDGAACCTYKNKVFVAGGRVNPRKVEMYDPVSGTWVRVKRLPKDRSLDHQLVVSRSLHNRDTHWVISFSNTFSSNSEILAFRPDAVEDEITWMKVPSLLRAVNNTSQLTSTYQLSILDMVYF